MSCRLPTVISGKKRSREIGISFERCFEPWETRRHDADGWAHQIEPLERLNAETIARDSTDSGKRRVSGENVLEAKEVHGAESLWPNPNLDNDYVRHNLLSTQTTQRGERKRTLMLRVRER